MLLIVGMQSADRIMVLNFPQGLMYYSRRQCIDGSLIRKDGGREYAHRKLFITNASQVSNHNLRVVKRIVYIIMNSRVLNQE